MLAGDPSVGRYTDAWYLGSLLAWMLTGQPPGSQHGPQWLPPGLPAGPVGDQVTAVVRALCCPDPRGRMDLGQAQAVLVDAAAGRVSAHLTGPAAPGGVGAGPGVVMDATVPDPALGPTARFTGGVPAYGSPSYGSSGPSSPQTYPGTDAPDGRPAASRTWRRVAVAAVAVVIVAAVVLWASTLGDDDAPPAASSSGRTVPSTGPAPSSADPGTTSGAGSGGSSADPAGQTATGPTYSAARIQPILDDLYEATKGVQFIRINFYPDYVVATALSEPGAATFDSYTWRDGKVTKEPALIQPKSEDLFDATTVDWSQAEVLASRMPELTGVDNPDETYVFVSRGLVSKDLQFQVSTSDDYYDPIVRADPNGNVTQMSGGKPGSPAAD